MNNTQYKYMVGVRCFTFQHAKYITDTLNGFCMQQTDFPYLCMVVDDASTDGEQQVIRQYIAEHFNVTGTRPISDSLGEYVFADHQKNKNCSLVYVELAKNLHGIKGAKMKLLAEWRENCKYQALCEGDDYWIDPSKLQKQVEILEEDDSLMACFTSCSVVDENGKTLEAKRTNPVVKDNKQGRYTLRDFMIQNHQYPTASVLFRNTYMNEIGKTQDYLRNPYMGDWTFWIALLLHGDVYYLDSVMTAYRINPHSLTHDVSKFNQRRLGYAEMQFWLLPRVASILPEKGFEDIKHDLTTNTAWMWFNLAHAQRKSGLYIRMGYSLLRSFLKNPIFFCKKIISIIYKHVL